jgi:ATP-binding cassette subfamily F protein uup
LIIDDFSARVMRGDRIGLIGPNGAGKTTLLRLLLEEITPDEGAVRHGANVQIAYYDQQREQLDPERTVFETVGEGNETVTANGRTRHVHAYLRDFLFSDDRARSSVKALSGGERNRLLLARLFTRPANVLVLDEPTNDLDLETLELLEEQLVEWPGTLLLVSHDRAFLDNVVTSTLVFEGQGRVQAYVGGFADWVRQRRGNSEVSSEKSEVRSENLEATAENSARRKKPIPGSPLANPDSKRKLSYKEHRELEGLPARIEALEAEQRALNDRISGADFYKEAAEAIRTALARVDTLQAELAEAYARWHRLESRSG